MTKRLLIAHFQGWAEAASTGAPAARGERAEVQGSWTAGVSGSCKIRTCDPLVQLDSRSARNPQLRGSSWRKHARRLRTSFPRRGKLALLVAARPRTPLTKPHRSCNAAQFH